MLAGGANGKMDDGMWSACSTVLVLSIRMRPESVKFIDTIHDAHTVYSVLSAAGNANKPEQIQWIKRRVRDEVSP